MKPNGRFLFFVENLTVLSWVPIAFFLLFHRLKDVHLKFTGFYIDTTRPGLFAARMTSWLLGADFKEFRFHQIDVRDEEGSSLRLKTSHVDAPLFKTGISASGPFSQFLSTLKEEPILETFLVKQAALGGSPRLLLGKTLFLIRAIDWKARHKGGKKEGEIVLFLNRRLWMRSIALYAQNFHIRTVFVPDGKINLREFLIGALGPRKVKFLRNIFYRFVKRRTMSAAVRPFVPSRLGVEYYGQLHLDDPCRHSDFFFYPLSGLTGKDVAAVFHLPSDPLDEAKLTEIRKHGMEAVVFHPGASTVSSISSWSSPGKLLSTDEKDAVSSRIGRFPEGAWLKKEIRNYFEERDDWQQFFEANYIKVYTAWFKYTSSHCAVADALRRLGGIMTVYQRAFEEFPLSETMTAADVVFAFSPETYFIEKHNRSFIPYHVAVGYLADYRFPLLRQKAGEIRNRLRQNGAKHILAYFDENSLDDARWHFGHKLTRAHYAFLLEKVLREPWFGLVLKPKAFANLSVRLGEVADLLKEAEATGRCFVFKEGALQVSYPPAVAALAADVAIHGHLFAATAGMEAALAGVPTLLMDKEGWPGSKFYRLEKDKVVFTDWDVLWEACLDYWRNTGKIPGFGDWSLLWNELDPFRDGKAAERMGQYLKWLLDGFKDGLSRGEILADCAERYAQKWGRDKIHSG